MTKLRVICEPRRNLEKRIDIVLDDPDGFLDATDERGSPIIYSCRGVACGSCFVYVDDPTVFEPPDDNERAVLHGMGAECDNHRMACALRIRPGVSGTVRIKMAY